MAPVEEVHLYLYEVPVVFVVVVEQPVEGADVAMIGESEVTDTSSLALLQQEVEQPVVEEALLECVHTSAADAMEQVVVDIVRAKPLERLAVHLHGLVEVPKVRPLVRHFRGDEELLSGMAGEGIAGKNLRLSSHVHRSRVEVVDAVFDGIVYEAVYLVLVIRQAHHAETQQ